MTDHTALRITGPAELLTAIPRLLGFHPHDSLVLVGMRYRTIAVTARLNLADTTDHAPLAGSLAAFTRAGCTRVTAAIFTNRPLRPAPAPIPYAASIDNLVALLSADLELADALIQTCGQWRSYLCTDRSCCPSTGTPMPSAPSTFEAAATVAGMTVHASRSDLASRFAPEPDRTAQLASLRLLQATAVGFSRDGEPTLTGRMALSALRVGAKAAGDEAVFGDDADLRIIAVALRDTSIRDRVWAMIDNRTLNADEFLLDLARRMPAPYDAASLFLYGWSAWRRGNGTLAAMAVDRVLASDPGYAAAKLLLNALAAGIDPRSLRPLLPTTKSVSR